MKINLLSLFMPSKPKIALAVVLFLAFAPFVYYDNGIRCIKAPCPSENLGSAVNFLALSYDNSNARISVLLLISGIILSYLVSCVLIFIFSKKAGFSANIQKKASHRAR